MALCQAGGLVALNASISSAACRQPRVQACQSSYSGVAAQSWGARTSFRRHVQKQAFFRESSAGHASRHCASKSAVRCRNGSEGASEGSPTEVDKQRMEVVYDPKRTMDTFASEHDPDQSQRLRGITLFSPSKVNLFLRITSKRPDGYHDLASLFHVIDLGDVIKFSISPSPTRDSLTTNVSGVPLDDSNLIIKALKVFREKTGSKQHYWIHLDKRVPTGAGLGGGSGNAATALWAANQLSGEPASEADLMEWGGAVGSDVPFFFSLGAAYCTGRGEVVEDVPPPLPLDTPLVLVKPADACPTGEIYRRFKLAEASKADPQELLRRFASGKLTQDMCINDLEPPAFEVVPSLKVLKQRMQQAGRGRYSAVFMSGSGSTIVGVGDPEPPPFIYEEDTYRDVFISEAHLLTREKGYWYRPRTDDLSLGATSREGLKQGAGTPGM